MVYYPSIHHTHLQNLYMPPRSSHLSILSNYSPPSFIAIKNPTASITTPVKILTTLIVTLPIMIRIANGDATIRPMIDQYAVRLYFLNTYSISFAITTTPTRTPIPKGTRTPHADRIPAQSKGCSASISPLIVPIITV